MASRVLDLNGGAVWKVIWRSSALLASVNCMGTRKIDWRSRMRSTRPPSVIWWLPSRFHGLRYKLEKPWVRSEEAPLVWKKFPVRAVGVNTSAEKPCGVDEVLVRW